MAAMKAPVVEPEPLASAVRGTIMIGPVRIELSGAGSHARARHLAKQINGTADEYLLGVAMMDAITALDPPNGFSEATRNDALAALAKTLERFGYRPWQSDPVGAMREMVAAFVDGLERT